MTSEAAETSSGATPPHHTYRSAPRLGVDPPPQPTRRQWAGLLLLTLLACGARVWVVRSTPAIDPLYHGVTSQTYVDVATAFLEGRGWVWQDAPAVQHPPGYSLFLAFMIGITSDTEIYLSRILQVLLDACAVGLVWGVARRFAPLWTAWIAASAFALLPEFVGSPAPVLPDGMVTFWMALGIYGACRWGESGHLRWAGVLGCGAGVAMLLRSECVLLGPAAVAWALVAARPRRRALLGTVTCLMVVSALYGPWFLWKQAAARTGHAPVSGWSNTLFSGLAQRPNRFGLLSSDRYTGAIVHYRGIAWHSPEAAETFLALSKRLVATDPWLPLRATVARQGLLLTQVNVPWHAKDARRVVNRLALVVGVLLGLYAVIHGKLATKAAALLAAPLLLYCGSLGLVWHEPRFVVPGHLSILWLGASAFARPQTHYRTGFAVLLGAVATGVLVIGVWERSVNAATAARLAESAPSAPWQAPQPETIQGATLTRPSGSDGVVLTGAARDGFAVAWPPLPVVPGSVACVLVDVEMERGGAYLGLFQTVQFPQQPPEHLWLAHVRLASPGRYAVLLPVEDLIGRPIRVGLFPDPGTTGRNGADVVQCRIRRVCGWPIEPGPSRPIAHRLQPPA